MTPPYHIIIPCRYAASRLPGKPLLDIAGKPLIQHVYEAAARSHAAGVTIATDDERIAAAARAFQARAVMTGADHPSGTDRITEAAGLLQLPDDAVIVNVQGDEFGLPPALIDQVAAALEVHTGYHMATLYEPIATAEEFADPDVVKVVFDRNNTAVYFSRAAIPWTQQPYPGPAGRACRHLGIYAYRFGFLKQFTTLPPAPLEQSEHLEQLRLLYNGYRIYVAEAIETAGIGVDTDADLERARQLAAR